MVIGELFSVCVVVQTDLYLFSLSDDLIISMIQLNYQVVALYRDVYIYSLSNLSVVYKFQILRGLF